MIMISKLVSGRISSNIRYKKKMLDIRSVRCSNLMHASANIFICYKRLTMQNFRRPDPRRLGGQIWHESRAANTQVNQKYGILILVIFSVRLFR